MNFEFDKPSNLVNFTVQKRIREGLFLTAVAVSVFLVVAFSSYHAQDPGWSSSGNGHSVANIAGRFGAWWADFFLYLLGYIAYPFPFILALGAWVGFVDRNILAKFDYLLFAIKTVGFTMILLAGCVISALYFPAKFTLLPAHSGGLLGDIAARYFLVKFGGAGSAIMSLTLLMCGITLFTGLSWLALMKSTALWTRERFVAWREKRHTLSEAQAVPFSQHELSQASQAFMTPFSTHENHDTPYEAQQPYHPKETSTPSPFGFQPHESSHVMHDETPEFMQSHYHKDEFEDELEDELEDEFEDEFEDEYDEEESESHEFPEFNFDRLTEHEAPVVEKKEVSAPLFSQAPPPPIVIEKAEKKTVKATPQKKPKTKAKFPSIDLLDQGSRLSLQQYSEQDIEVMSGELEQRLDDFGIQASVVAVQPGPIVTRFEIDLAPGVKVSRITSLAKDLSRSLSTTSVRIVEVIPGRSTVGIELPNKSREIVRLREVLSTPQYSHARSPVSLSLGKDIAGHAIVVDLAKMPHLLVAGTTGSGKSVALNAMIISILYKALPDEVKLIMVDPKMLELSIYDGIPHLLTPVVTDMKEAATALRWCVAEMDRRYRLMSHLGVRNLEGYNAKIQAAEKAGKPIQAPEWQRQITGLEDGTLDELPTIVVVVDEFADMMMVVGKKVEQLIARIAQKARAAGIHLILATQRPSVNVITGLIKANIPTRIAFQVSSKIDSRTILDQPGADQLLGNGDMLYLPPGTGLPMRIHGAYVTDEEVHRVVEYWKTQGEPEYVETITDEGNAEEESEGAQLGEKDPLYDEAVDVVIKSRRASISSLQRRFRIGYNRAACLVEDMERAGVVGPMETNGTREVLVPSEEG